jgi:hypothetical protein
MHCKVQINAFHLKSFKWISITWTLVVSDCNAFDINGNKCTIFFELGVSG